MGDFLATAVEVTSSTELFAFVPSGVQADITYDVAVRNSDGTEARHPMAFTAVAPTLQFVNSATRPSGNAGSTVILEGHAFGDLQGPGRILFSDDAGGVVPATIASPDDWTDTFIVTTVPAGAGTGPIVVETGTGTSASLPFTVTQNAIFSPSTINWTETESLPSPLSGHRAVFVPIDDAGGNTVERVYVTGGAGNDLVPTGGVSYATIQTDGALGAWSAGTDLPSGVAFHAIVAATPFNSRVQGSGFLYTLGGVTTDGGDPVATVTRVSLDADGTTGAPVAARALPEGLHSHGAVLFRSTIYVVGGAAAGNDPVASVYRAAIDTLGNLGPWEALTPLPGPRAYHGLVSFGGFLYAVGGDAGAVAPNDAGFNNNATKSDETLYGRINLRTGDLSDGWTVNPATMQKSRSKHAALAAGGNLFVTSGLYAAAGTGSTENVFAQINADGTVASFGGATGSNTLLSEGGSNLFNSAAFAYVDGNGVAHVMVLGGDNVNAPGTKSSTVLFY